ncbi:MAG: hypothetical protein E7662_09190 [Ruminococcaceae bacterium]|nr:hypothetical protein [Oscillospiraceae bacterium]
MGYLHIVIALFFGQLKGFCGKKQSQYISGVRDAVVANFLRMLCCVATSLILLIPVGQLGALRLGVPGLLISLLSGIANAGIVVLWLLSVRGNAYVLLDVFSTFGVIVPLLLCRILYDEKIRLIQWCGFVLLCFAVWIMCSYSTSLKGKKMSAKEYLILIIYGLLNGTADFSQKLFVNTYPDGSKSVFNFYTFLFAAVVIGIVVLFLSRGKDVKPCPVKKIWIFIVIMAVSLFANAYFKTAAAEVLPAVQLYPLLQGGALSCAMLMAAILFGEKITKRSVLGITLCFAALLMINVL